MRRFLSPILNLLLVLNAGAQGPVISGHFINVPFYEFALQAEEQSGIGFHYKEEWTRDIFINAQGKEMDLVEILKENFTNRDLSVVLLDNNKIIILSGEEPVMILPEYFASSDTTVETKGLDCC